MCMAASGTIRQAIRTGYRIQIAWTVDSQSVANNTSTVTAKVQLVSTGSSYTINSTASKSGSLTINGTKYTFNFSAALSGNQTKTLYTKTVTVSHAADGTKTCSFSATCGINVTLSGTYYGNVTASGSGTFNTIARASTINSVTSSVSVNGTNAVQVNITRAASSFTHTVVFSFGSYSETTTGVETSTSYAIPTSWLNAIPNATSGTAKVTVTTYSGSTKIGSAVSENFTITVPSTVVPTISAVSLTEAVSGLAAQFGSYVQNKSKIAVEITAEGVYSSTIKTYKTTIQGANFTAASFTSGVLTKSGTSTVTITVTDSRGRTASTTRSITVTAYTAPKITSFQGFRCLANGTENYEGTYLNAAVNFSISSVGSKNTASYTVEYKLKTATSWTALTSGSVYALNSNIVSASGLFSVDSSYDIRLSVSDHFGTVTSSFDIPTAFTLLDFNDSGQAVAFGKVSELEKGVEFGIPVVMSHPLPVESGGTGANNAEVARSNLGLGNAAVKMLSGGQQPNTDRVAYIAWDGVMEIGKYIDFHDADTTTDYDFRIMLTNGSLYFSGNASFGGNNLNDFVVERSTSGGWEIEKWASGLVKLWGNHNLTGIACTTLSQGTYYSSSPPTVNMPDGLLKTLLRITGSPGFGSQSSGSFLHKIASANTKLCTLDIRTFTSQPSVNYPAFVQVWGTWK